MKSAYIIVILSVAFLLSCKKETTPVVCETTATTNVPPCEVELDVYHTFDSVAYHANAQNPNAGFILYYHLTNSTSPYITTVAFNDYPTSGIYNFTDSLNGTGNQVKVITFANIDPRGTFDESQEAYVAVTSNAITISYCNMSITSPSLGGVLIYSKRYFNYSF